MGNWVVDLAHSTVGFEVKHMMVSKVRGKFDRFEAKVIAEDLADLENATIEFTFDVNSINTGNNERDHHLKSVDFFDVINYPTIEFQSTSIKKYEDNYKVTGQLTIKGITKLVTFDVVYGGKATAPWGTEIYGYEAFATINREEFGLVWNAALETGGLLIGQEIKIKAELEISEEGYDFSEKNWNEHQIESGNINLEQKEMKNELHRLIAENLTDLVAIINRKGNIHYVTPSFESVLNYQAANLKEKNFFDMIHPTEQKALQKEILSYSGRMLKKEWNHTFRIRHAEGQYIDVDAKMIAINEQIPLQDDLLLVIMRDVSECKIAENTIYQLAFHDALTNLPNRRSFMNHLRSEVLNRETSKAKLAILMIDLDNFKQINDQWGHGVGDIVLKEAANRIQAAIRSTDVAARIGGDEFVVMVRDIEDEADAILIAEQIFTQLQTPITESGQDYLLTCSIGISYFPNHGETAEDLMKHADTALYYVKERGKNNVMIFNQQMEDQSLERRILANALRQGIKEQQFYLEYQPKLNMITNELIGMEVLVRWNHPELGVISPGKFIPLAEETGLIVPLGEWILRESCRQTVEWQNKGFPPLILSVNVSVRQMEDAKFIDKVKRILHETGLDPKWLEFEITESVLANVRSMIPIIKELRELGIHISVDDFGTGYSSLAYIKELPIDTLKIDRSFVRDIHMNKESKEIAKAIINLANSIGLNVIAEGVEQQEHVDALSKDGCILGQGYYYSRPLKVDAFEGYMASNNISWVMNSEAEKNHKGESVDV